MGGGEFTSATMKPAGMGTTTLCCSKRTLHADNKAVKVSWMKETFFEGSSRDKKTALNIIHCLGLVSLFGTAYN